MTTASKRLPLTKAQSTGNQFANTALDKSGFLESIKQDSHLFTALAGNRPQQVDIRKEKEDIKASTMGNFPNMNLRENPQQMQLYDEVSKLKLKEKRMEQTIKQLRHQNKDNHKPGLTKKEAEQLTDLRRQNKELNRSLFQAKTNLKGHSQKRIVSTLQKQKIADLLRVIEKYKNQAFSAEEQLKRYQEGQQYSKGATPHNNASPSKYHQTPVTNSQYINELSVIKQSRYGGYDSPSMNLEMKRLKELNVFLQAEVSKMKVYMENKDLMQNQIFDLKMQKQTLENKLIKISESPLFGGMNERLEDETKMKTLEDKLKMYNDRYEKEKEKVIRLQTELKMTQAQLVDANVQAQTNQTENVKLRSRIKQHPIIDVILRDETMLQQVIGYLQAENYRSDILGQGNKSLSKSIKDNPLQKIETLIAENQLLALELTKNQTMLRTLKQIYEEHEKVRQLEHRQFSELLEQKDKRINQLAVLAGQKDKIEVTKNGIRYEDDVSVFSHDERIMQESGINYFDIYLAELNLVDTFVRQQIKIADVSRIMNFATVDFYNHQTQNTKVASGLRYNMNSQFSFKVVEDECLFNFFEKGEVTINIWTTDGGKTILLGEGKISLKPMITNAKSNTAPVVRSSVPLYLNNKSIGSLNFVTRMRYPVYKLLSQMRSTILNSINEPQAMNLANYETRELVVKVEAAEGLPMNVSSFVYYTINNNDYYTEPFNGSHPIYDHMNIVSICYTPEFEQQLRRGDLEFTVLDDNAPTYDNNGSDLIGISRISLSKLLFPDGRISESLRIINRNGEIKGNLIVKVFWSQNTTNQARMNNTMNNTIAQGAGNLFGSFGDNNTFGGYNNSLINNSIVEGDLFTAKFINDPNMNMSNGNMNIMNRSVSGLQKMLFSNNNNNNANNNYMNNSYMSNTNNMNMSNMLAQGFNNMSNRKPFTNEEITQYVRNKINQSNIAQVFNQIDDNGTGVVKKGELKQGLAAYFGINLNQTELDSYFASFEKPITLDSFAKGLGIRLGGNQNDQRLKKATSIESNISNKNTRYSVEDLNSELRKYMSDKNITIEELYIKFDDNKTKLISKDQLKDGLAKHFRIKLTQDQLTAYFKSFKQPLDFQSFKRGLTNMTNTINSPVNQNNEELKNINKLIQKNTSILKKTSLKQFLKDKDLFSVSLEIDKDNSGTITKKEIQKYLEEKGLTTDEKIDDKMSVMDFLKKHSSVEEPNIHRSMNMNIPRTTSFMVNDPRSRN